jgi:DNA repair protein RecN (Recombination protein N)
MIEYLRITDLGVIASAHVELAPGFVAVTGETGAGKTMVMTALDLLFGGKPNPAVVRAGAERATVEAGLRVVQVPEVVADLEAVEDGLLLVSRSVGGARSRAWVGGRGVPAAVLAELGDELVIRHGQNDQRRLAHAAHRRRLLDRFAGPSAEPLLAACAAAHDELRALQAEHAELAAADRTAAQRADLLRHGVAEIDAAAPEAGEEEALRAELSRLSNVVDLRIAAEAAYEALRGADEGSAEAGLAAAGARLDQAARSDPALEPLSAALAQAAALAADVASDLASYAARLEADPQRLDAVQHRLGLLRGLQRKYGDTLAEVLDWARDAAGQLAVLDTAEDRLAHLQRRIAGAQERAARAALALSEARAAAARRLTDAVNAELAALALPDAALVVEVVQVESPQGLPLPDGRRVLVRRDGADDVAFRFAAHPGAAPLPIGEGASGGELSRVMLALEVALAGANPVPVLVFDEVDAGIGGRAAVEVGRRLAALARSAQVIVVTHLPQVAAFADQHVVVRKDRLGQVTASSVVSLQPQEQQREVARMLAGLDGSDSAMAHAAELIDLAAQERERSAAGPVSAGAAGAVGRGAAGEDR